MMWFKKLLYRWAMAGGSALSAMPKQRVDVDWASTNPTPTQRPESPAECMITLRKAVNGYFLELAQHKPQVRGPDWQYSYFVLDETADLAPAIATLLVKQRLEQ